MPTPSAADCPRCGNSETTVISARRVYASSDPRRQGQPIATDYVFRCRCGREFLRSLNEEPVGEESRLQSR